MPQSTLIVGGIMALFFVWVTQQNHLSNYLADLGFGVGSGTATPASALGAIGGATNFLSGAAGMITMPGSTTNLGTGGLY